MVFRTKKPYQGLFTTTTQKNDQRIFILIILMRVRGYLQMKK